MSSFDVTVVGGGIAGLAASVILARRGRAVRLIEERVEVGGLAASHEFRGVPCDLGSHRLHPGTLDRSALRDLLPAFALEERPRRGLLLLGGRRIPYPATVGGLMAGLGPARALEFGTNLLRTRALSRWERERVPVPDQDVGFAAFVRRRAGDAAFEAFYRPYVEKIWGLPAEEISQTVAKARVSADTPAAALLSLLSRRQPARFQYPVAGISGLVTALERELTRRGGVVECGTSASGELPGTVLWSGRLRDLVPGPFEHRGVYLLYLAFPVNLLGEHETYYTPERAFWFGRVSEIKHYSERLGRPGETVLTVEIPEGTWGRDRRFDRGDALEEVLDQLARLGITRGLRPLEAAQRHVPDVYPLYRRGWLADWDAAVDRVSARGVLPFGRQGLFLHCNIHHCVQMAEAVAAHALSGLPGAAWAERARSFVGLRVLD